MASKLDQINPSEAWQTAAESDWDLKWATHLYRRAAFGLPPHSFFGGESGWEAMQLAIEQGREASVERLLEGGSQQQADFDQLMDGVGANLATSRDNLAKLQGWWLYRMLNSPHPLLERATLFWHDHFATSVNKVRQLDLMLGQNQLLRSHALGKFSKLLRSIGRDPAMVLWLDSNSNIKGQPNENYAREVMELFSLGEGNYTEKDIQQAARALTGLATTGGKFVFKTANHDADPKTVLGQTGNWNDEDIVRILLEQPAAARHLVRKLYQEFISESQSPPDRLIEPLAQQLRTSDYDMKQCLGTIFRSQLFYSAFAYRQRIKSPVEYVVGMLNALDAKTPMAELADAMDGLGQSLFAPPNVKGWEGGQQWLNSASLLTRHNLAWRLVGNQDHTFEGRVDLVALLDRFGKKSPRQQLDFLLDLLLQGDVNEQGREKLFEFIRKGAVQGDSEETRLRELAHTILLMPEYQLA